MSFPSNPTNGQTHAIGPRTYAWSSAKGRWEVSRARSLSSSALTESTVQNLVQAEIAEAVGTSLVDSAVNDALSDINNALSTLTAQVSQPASEVQTYETPGNLPTTNVANGTLAIVTSNGKLYYYANGQWRSTSTETNLSPVITSTGLQSTYNLNVDLTPTTIEYVATDPEGITLSYSVQYITSNAENFVTITRVGNNFVVTPTGVPGTVEAKFIVSDGAYNLQSETISFIYTNDSPDITDFSVDDVAVNTGATIQFAGDGTAIGVIMAATDPENQALTFSFTTSAGTGTTLDNSTIAVDDSYTFVNTKRWVITPPTDAVHVGNFDVTFSVSDGVNTSTRTLTFNLDAGVFAGPSTYYIANAKKAFTTHDLYDGLSSLGTESYAEAYGFRFPNLSVAPKVYWEKLEINPTENTVVRHPLPNEIIFGGSGDTFTTDRQFKARHAFPGPGHEGGIVYTVQTPEGCTARNVTINPTGTAFSFGLVAQDGTAATKLLNYGGQIFRWNKDTGIGTKYAIPAALNNKQVQDIFWHPSGNAVVLTIRSLNYTQGGVNADHGQVLIFAWDSVNGYGSELASIPTSSSNSGIHIEFSPSGNYIAVGGGLHNNHNSFASTFIKVYNFSTSTGIGTLVHDFTPQTIVNGSSRTSQNFVTWSPDEKVISLSSGNIGGTSPDNVSTQFWKWSSSGIGDALHEIPLAEKPTILPTPVSPTNSTAELWRTMRGVPEWTADGEYVVIKDFVNSHGFVRKWDPVAGDFANNVMWGIPDNEWPQVADNTTAYTANSTELFRGVFTFTPDNKYMFSHWGTLGNTNTFMSNVSQTVKRRGVTFWSWPTVDIESNLVDRIGENRGVAGDTQGVIPFGPNHPDGWNVKWNSAYSQQFVPDATYGPTTTTSGFYNTTPHFGHLNLPGLGGGGTADPRRALYDMFRNDVSVYQEGLGTKISRTGSVSLTG